MCFRPYSIKLRMQEPYDCPLSHVAGEFSGECRGNLRVLAARPYVAFWLKADFQPPEIDFRFAPNSGRFRDLG